VLAVGGASELLADQPGQVQQCGPGPVAGHNVLRLPGNVVLVTCVANLNRFDQQALRARLPILCDVLDHANHPRDRPDRRKWRSSTWRHDHLA
jgi:hypothetical protein